MILPGGIAFWRDFGGANVPAADLLDFTWNVGLAASYPLFSGGKKAVDVRSSRIQQRQIRLQLDNIKQQLELAVRARALALMSKATNIHFAKVAGNTAQESYELTLDAYRKGQVSLTQLVDAQSTAFAAQEAQANATYQYLIALFELENVVGSYPSSLAWSTLSSRARRPAGVLVATDVGGPRAVRLPDIGTLLGGQAREGDPRKGRGRTNVE